MNPLSEFMSMSSVFTVESGVHTCPSYDLSAVYFLKVYGAIDGVNRLSLARSSFSFKGDSGFHFLTLRETMKSNHNTYFQ